MEVPKDKPQDPIKLIALTGNNQELSIERVLGHIYDYLHTDLEQKKEQIEELNRKIKQLEKELTNYQYQLTSLKSELAFEKEQQEGSKQLINKLLEDIKRYQNDIEWYKRTYEKRSLLGTLKEKLINRK
ncbi:MAG: hypothetical protein EKK37_07670 [Sphingobacteriales bacterium]|nr:MAG: hypothetical protein EKK37_07670 [Sphingobacteriales bacterium]